MWIRIVIYDIHICIHKHTYLFVTIAISVGISKRLFTISVYSRTIIVPIGFRVRIK